jgi:hypothetical protein
MINSIRTYILPVIIILILGSHLKSQANTIDTFEFKSNRHQNVIITLSLISQDLSNHKQKMSIVKTLHLYDGQTTFSIDRSVSEVLLLDAHDEQGLTEVNHRFLTAQLIDKKVKCAQNWCIKHLSSTMVKTVPIHWKANRQRYDSKPPNCLFCDDLNTEYFVQGQKINRLIKVNPSGLFKRWFGGSLSSVKIRGQWIKEFSKDISIPINAFTPLLDDSTRFEATSFKGMKRDLSRPPEFFNPDQTFQIKEYVHKRYNLVGYITHVITGDKVDDLVFNIQRRYKCSDLKLKGMGVLQKKKYPFNKLKSLRNYIEKSQPLKLSSHTSKILLSNESFTKSIKFKNIYFSSNGKKYTSKLKRSAQGLSLYFCGGKDTLFYLKSDTNDMKPFNPNEFSISDLIDWSQTSLNVVAFDNSSHAMDDQKSYDQVIKQFRDWAKNTKHYALFTTMAGGRINKNGLKTFDAKSSLVNKLFTASDAHSNPLRQTNTIIRDLINYFNIRQPINLIYVTSYTRKMSIRRMEKLNTRDANIHIIYLDPTCQDFITQSKSHHTLQHQYRCIQPQVLQTNLDQLLSQL